MGRVFVTVAALAWLLGACSIMPDMPSFAGGGTPMTNDAVEACKRAARAAGYSNVGQQQVTPADDGRYVVTLQGEGDNGYENRTCVFDPASGARIQKAEK
jgi:hypothetical protein